MKREAFSSTSEGVLTGRICAHPDCEDMGDYRAPKTRHGPRSYYWFCLQHVREYNAAWNYCAGMSQQELEAEIRQDTVWRRPSWPLGTLAGTTATNFDRLREQAAAVGGWSPRDKEQSLLTSAERKAFATLGLTPPASQGEIRQRYKKLAKLLHPDANGSDRKAEERLKLVNHAYATLRCCSRAR